MNYLSCSLLRFVARVLFAALFFLAGMGKLTDPSMYQQYMAAKGLTMVTPLIYLSAAIEIFGAIFLLLGYWTRTVATILALFLLIVTLVMHNFWALDPKESAEQLVEFLKNLGIIGGLLYVISSGPGHWAICKDDSCSHR